MKKETFVKVIALIQEQEQIDTEVSKALERISDSFITLNANNKKYDALHMLLKELMDDTEDFISWWLYEDVVKKIWVLDKEIDVSTPEKLYDFLTSSFEL